MLRRGPTAITLGESDLRDFKVRAQRRREVEKENRKQELERSASAVQDEPGFDTRAQQIRRSLGAEQSIIQSFSRPLTIQTQRSEGVTSTILDSGTVESSASLDAFSNGQETGAPEDTEEGIDISSRAFSPENVETERHPPSSPLKDDDFHYGGFVDSPSEDYTQTRASSFAPEDSSTPQPRDRLPRSPLYLSQNAISPEQRPTSGLTPRVVSRVANHNSPGMLFARPPRRPPPNHRSFRHQTNSFSYDSTERSSAAYDQERASSSSTNNSTFEPQREISLEEELDGVSLARSPSNSDDSSSEKSATDPDDYMLVLPQDAQEDPGRSFIFSSPPLPLPPPFSTVPRTVSGEHVVPHPQTSPMAVPSPSPPRGDTDEEQTTPKPRSLEADGVEVMPRSTSGRNLTPSGLLARLRLAYRARSPIGRRGILDTSASPSPSSRSQGAQLTPGNPQPQTPGLDLNVYNDTLPPDSQPQTPAHLPGARHQSRYHPSYTAPIDGGNARRSARLRSNQAPFATPTRRGIGRSGSPTGLMTSGFQGLYGGRENGDEERNWVEGVRSDNQEVRLLGLRDARNDGRSLNDTPEREEFRPGR